METREEMITEIILNESIVGMKKKDNIANMKKNDFDYGKGYTVQKYIKKGYQVDEFTADKEVGLAGDTWFNDFGVRVWSVRELDSWNKNDDHYILAYTKVNRNTIYTYREYPGITYQASTLISKKEYEKLEDEYSGVDLLIAAAGKCGISYEDD